MQVRKDAFPKDKQGVDLCNKRTSQSLSLISYVLNNNHAFTLSNMLCWFTSLNKKHRLTAVYEDKPINLEEYIYTTHPEIT